MNYRIVKPLALAISLGLTLSSSATIVGIDKAKLDTKLSPCVDFAGYVNNISQKENPIPADLTSWGNFEKLREQSLTTQHDIVDALVKNPGKPGTIEQKVGDFYAAGMDETKIDKDGFNPIKEDLKRIDGLKSAEDIAQFLRDARAQGDGYLFDFGAFPDFKNSNQVIAYATQGGLGLPDRDYYVKEDASSKKLRDAYVEHITKHLELVGVKHDAAAKQAQAILALETRLAKASLTKVELRDPANQYHLVSIDDANKVTAHFPWEKFFASQNIKDVKSFSLSQPKFFTEMDKMLGEIPMADWQAYFRFHIVNDAAPYLSKPFVDQQFEFYSKTLRGQKEQKPRWKRVLAVVNDQMGMALGQLFVAKTFPPEAKERALDLVNNLRAALKVRIDNLDWMSPETKKLALEKWGTFMPKIGYPDEWRDWTGLTIGHDSYFANIRAAAKFNHEWDTRKIGKPVDRKEWGMTPQMVNAYYNPLLNEIVFPAAILQSPFFDAKADDALNYGGIGMVIGHEMIHGYDDEGSKFDAQGNMKNWWSPEDRKKFEERTGKLVKQFDEYVVIDDLHVNGKLTLGENIADLGGLNIAYDALQVALKKKPQDAVDGLSPDQRFFINLAQVWSTQRRPEEVKLLLNTDPHAPAQFRAIAAPSNMPTFAKAFSCKATDAMVRSGEKQVKIW